MIRLCHNPSCDREASYRGLCEVHSKDRERGRMRSGRMYDKARWKIARRRQLFEQPLCHCGEIATEVDHVVPLAEGGDEWAPANLQSLCHGCHSRKTAGEVNRPGGRVEI